MTVPLQLPVVLSELDPLSAAALTDAWSMMLVACFPSVWLLRKRRTGDDHMNLKLIASNEDRALAIRDHLLLLVRPRRRSRTSTSRQPGTLSARLAHPYCALNT